MSRNRLAIYVDFYQGGIGKRFKVGAEKKTAPQQDAVSYQARFDLLPFIP